jgi:hypothetical protein
MSAGLSRGVILAERSQNLQRFSLHNVDCLAFGRDPITGKRQMRHSHPYDERRLDNIGPVLRG